MDNVKSCTVCKLSKLESDFIGNQTECYKCVYARKTSKSEKPVENRFCRVCKNKIRNNRRRYCSSECYDKRKYWTHKINIDTQEWKRRFNPFR